MAADIRRVQKTGASTLTVSLPKDWADSIGIKAGDQVAMSILDDGTILIDTNTGRKRDNVKRTVWASKEESREHLTRKLIGAYLAGYNMIEVRSKERLDPSIKTAIRDFSRLVIGPEIIEENANSILMHDLSDPVELPQEKCVRRMHLIIASMHGDAIVALESVDTELAIDVIDRDTDVDRLYWMAVKQYNLITKDRRLGERIGVDINESNSLMLVARGVERIGDHAEKIAKNVLRAKEEGLEIDTTEIKKLSAESIDVLDKAVESFFRKDIDMANDTIDHGANVVRRCEGLSHSRIGERTNEAIVGASIIDSLIRTTMYAMDISEIAINGAMRKEEH